MKNIILDHDLGTNPDDFFSLLMLLNSAEVDLKLVISGNNFSAERSRLANKIMKQQGNEEDIIVSGEDTGHIYFHAHDLIEGVEDVVLRDYKVEIKNVLDNNEDVTYLCIQGTSNISSFLKTYPEYIDTFEIIHMGMSKPRADFITGGTNMEADQLGAKYLYELGLNRLKVVGSHTTVNDLIRVTPKTDLYKKISTSTSLNHKMLLKHMCDYHKRRGIWPALHDPLTTSVALGFDFVNFEEISVDFNERGEYRLGNKLKIMISKKDIQKPEIFMNVCTQRV